MISNTSCLMLDAGRVLLDLDPRQFARRMQDLTGLSEERLGRVLLNNGLVQDYETGRIDDGEFHRRVCEKCGVDVPRRAFEDAWNSIFEREPILSEKLLSDLSARLRMYVVSNTNRMHFNYIATHYSFLRHFRGYVLSHEVGALKPEPSIFSHALRRARAHPYESLFVDDQPANVDAARRMGLDAFQFLSPEQFERELRLRSLL
jgi:FMN phosphatase YigB (HAD superfamily)